MASRSEGLGTSFPSQQPQTGTLPTSQGIKGAKSLNTQSKCCIVLFTISGIASMAIIGLSIAQTFGPIGSTGFNASITGGGLGTLISGGGLGMAIANCKQQAQQNISSKSQNWQQLLRRTSEDRMYTNVTLYANQCVEQLAQHHVPVDGYQKLIVWQISRQSPDVFTIDGPAYELENLLPTLPPRSILLLAVIDLDLNKKEQLNLKNIILNRKIDNPELRGDESRLVFHFVSASKDLLGQQKVHLSAQQCEEIKNHQGIFLPVISH